MTTPLEERIKSNLNNPSQSLDAETSQRLQAIRSEALNQPPKQGWFSMRYWMPVTGLAFCSLIAGMLFFPSLSSNNTGTLSQTAMLELLESPDDLEIIADPAFYLWMDELDAQEG